MRSPLSAAYLLGMAEVVDLSIFGVPGYGLDQAFLRYLEEGRRFGFDVVLIGFMTENIFRHA